MASIGFGGVGLVEVIVALVDLSGVLDIIIE